MCNKSEEHFGALLSSQTCQQTRARTKTQRSTIWFERQTSKSMQKFILLAQWTKLNTNFVFTSPQDLIDVFLLLQVKLQSFSKTR